MTRDPSEDATDQARRTPPTGSDPQGTGPAVNDDAFDDTPEERRRAEHPANKERGGTIAGGGSRDE